MKPHDHDRIPPAWKRAAEELANETLNRLAARNALVRAALELHDVLYSENCRIVSSTYERPSERVRRAQQEFARTATRYRELGGGQAEDGYRETVALALGAWWVLVRIIGG